MVNAKMLAKICDHIGLDSKIVSNGKEAVDEIAFGALDCCEGGTGERFKYSAVLIDNSMPIMCGPEATKLIRELGYTKPIIGVTGNALDDDVMEFKKCGASEVLIKPTNYDKLKGILEKLEIL
jgi:CheY-like chemotaxis protein